MRALLEYLAGLTVTQGAGLGEPFPLFPWEKRFIRGAFGTSGHAALTVGRGNGKTTLLAGVGAATVEPDGPLHIRRGEAVIVASSFEQARLDFEHVRAFLEAKGYDLDDKKKWRCWDTAQQARIEYKPTGAKVKCIGSDPKRAHGLAPSLVLADEPAQWPRSTRDAMRAALRTAMGKQPGSKFIALGTQPADPFHWFKIMLGGVGAAYVQEHAADKADPKFHKRTWYKANPSLRYMPDLLAEIEEEARAAKRDPSMLASFEALRLNLGTPDTEQSTLLEAGTWEEIERPDEGEQAGRYALGIDLGSGAAMSAAAGWWPSGDLEALAVFPELPSLEERGLRDGVAGLYTDMHARGELLIAGRRVASIPGLLQAVLKRWGRPGVIICDRWREDELRDALEAVKFPLVDLVTRGQGFRDGSQDVREFRKACLSDRVRPSKSLLLRAAMSEARVKSDDAANTKLSKGTEGGRRARAKDDAVAAAVLAVAEGVRRFPTGRAARKKRGFRYHGVIGRAA